MSIPMTPEDMKRGIQTSLNKCKEHLESAELLVTNGHLNNAIIHIEFAIEEFGRAVYLRNQMDAGSTSITNRLFTSHTLKYDQAWTVLDSNLKRIYEGSFDPAVFDSTVFDTGGTISPTVRVDATFVNFINGEWKDSVRANPESLKRIIDEIREEITTF